MLKLKHTVRSQDVTRDESLNPDGADCIRIFRTSPEGALLQLRSFGPTNDRRNGKPHHVLTNADYLSADELRKIAYACTAIADELDSIKVVRDALAKERNHG